MPSPACDGVLQRGDRVGVAAGAKSGHDVEVVAVAGGDDQVVVVEQPGGSVSTTCAAGSMRNAAAWTKSMPRAAQRRLDREA